MNGNSIKMSELEIDFIVDLLIDFEKTTNIDKIYEAIIKNNICGEQLISKEQIEFSIKKKLYQDTNKFNLKNLFK